jgi:CsoR family transcriptional regulator, copper-sensing transcriptional repressor
MAKQESRTTPTRGYSATKEQLLKRLARVEGQVRGVSGMVENERYCIDVLTQISAIQAALDKISLGLIDDHARHCMQGKGGAPTDPEEQVNELMGALGRLLHR